jgi:hypothetical protein
LRDRHESNSDPEARLFKRCRWVAALPSYLGQVLRENRQGSRRVVAAGATQSSTRAEREARLAMMDGLPRAGPITLGADHAYPERDFVEGLRARGIVPQVAEGPGGHRRVSHLRANEREDAGFEVSQRARKLVEKVLGWGKQARPVKQMKLRGLRRADWMFRLAMATHSRLRLQKLIPVQ